MLVYRKNPTGIWLFPNVKKFFFFFFFCIAVGRVSEKDLHKYATAGHVNLKKKKQLLQK